MKILYPLKRDKFRISTMNKVWRFSAFRSPSHRKSFIPAMSLFKCLKLLLSGFYTFLRVTIAFVRAKFLLRYSKSGFKRLSTIETLFSSSIKINWFSPNIRKSGVFKGFRMFLKRVLAWAKKKFEIFNSIILYVVINMMNYLPRLKISTNLFFHYEAMFRKIPLFSRKWMFRTFDIKVTTPDYFSSMPPHYQYYNTGNKI